MPRQARIKIAGLPWHVVHRGHNRDACFFAPADYVFYLNHLNRLSTKHGCAIHAYALMTNHVHLLLTPTHEESASKMMKELAQLASRRTTARKRTGALWEGRFRSSIVETATYLLRCYRYVELNPVRAALVRDPAQYPWSSCRSNAYGEFSPVITPHPQFLALADDEAARRDAYRTLLGNRVSEGELAFFRNRSRGGFVIGEPDFEHDISRASGRSAAPTRKSRGDRLSP